jgi:hypothetical protein
VHRRKVKWCLVAKRRVDPVSGRITERPSRRGPLRVRIDQSTEIVELNFPPLALGASEKIDSLPPSTF